MSPSSYIEPEPLAQTLAGIRTSAALEVWLKQQGYDLSAKRILSSISQMGPFDDPAEAVRILLFTMLNAPGSVNAHDASATLTGAFGLPATLAAWTYLLSPDVTVANPTMVVMGAVQFVQQMTSLHLLTWNDPAGIPLREKLKELGRAETYLNAPDIDEDALLDIWHNTRFGAGASVLGGIGFHPAATVAFWRQAITGGQDVRLIGPLLATFARPRQDRVIRAALLTHLYTHDMKGPVEDMISESSHEVSGEVTAFALEAAFRDAQVKPQALHARLQATVERLSRSGRLTDEALEWLSQSDSGAVRQWAILEIAPMASSKVPQGVSTPAPVASRLVSNG